MINNHSRGFTLIELLVVIAIIGVLSAVVLASLNTARTKGNDAAVQSDFTTVQIQAEIFYGSAGANSYGTAGSSCTTAGSLFADTTIARAITAAEAANGTTNNVVCGNSTSAYAISAGLLGGGYWCVDSTGFAGARTTALTAGATVCPAS
jgi:prepilin-type N-terminal cleavage/methylation domain-containing protein